MKKKLLAILMVSALAISMLAGCGSSGAASTDSKEEAAGTDSKEEAASTDNKEESKDEGKTAGGSLKVGVVLVGDENEGYTYSHIEGIRNAAKAVGLADSDLIWKYSIPEDEKCYDALVDCIDQGATLCITNSYGHQSYAQQAAEEYPDVTIVAMTGDKAAVSGLSNLKNAFTKIYEARYVSGAVAGLKLKEMIDKGELGPENYDGDNVKIGYVGAFPYAEVVSGYTAFYLGVKSIVPNVVMSVQYTQSWFDITKEKEAAVALMGDGCCIIGQHADSTGAPSACEEARTAGKNVYSVGYNVDMLATAPTAALTSPTNVWEVYYEKIFTNAKNGEEIPTDWAEGYDAGAVKLTPLGKSCAEGTQEKVDELIAKIKDGSLHVFDTANFTVGGKKLDSVKANVQPDDAFEPDTEAISDGYFHESEYRAAPYFELRIDGITEK